MTDMDYKERYEKALKRAETAINIAADKDLVKGVATTIFPELRESEDERIRKEIINFLRSPFVNENITDEKVAPWIAWLERQKYPNEDYLNNPAFLDGFDTGREVQKIFDEQKPASTEDMPHITDEHFYEREPKDSFRYKLAKYMTQNCRKEESPDGYTYHISAETILEMAKEELLKRGVVQKPAEWSNKEYGRLFDIEHYLDGTLQLSTDRKIACIDFLKSLRPQPKQQWSEEDNIGWDEAFACVTRAEKAAKNEEELQNAVTAEKWLKEIKFKYYVHPVKQEWSEEDKNGMFSDIIMAIRAFYKCEREDLVDYVKSLRPQPKVELSEDVKKTLDEVSHILIGLNYKQVAKDYKQAIEKLLYSRPSWKPTEEQMEAFRSYIKDFQEKAEAAVGGWNNFDVMIRLFEQLNKLKGGVAPMRDIDE